MQLCLTCMSICDTYMYIHVVTCIYKTTKEADYAE